MAVKIRLKRAGMPKQPSYRIVVCDSKNQRDGAVIANLGFYSPYKRDKLLHFDIELYNEWLEKGAQPSETVKKLARQFEKKSGGPEATAETVKGKAVAEETPASKVSAENEPAGQTSTTATE